MTTSTQPSHQGSSFEVLKVFLTLGLTSFGGPVAHLGYFRKELIEKRGWLSEHSYDQLVALCQFLPGPASSQVGFALGLHRAGWLGAFIAFLAFTLPSVVILITFANSLHFFEGNIAQAGLTGLKLLACAVVADAVWSMSKNLCPDCHRRLFALFTFVSLLFIQDALAQISIIMAGAMAGYFFLNQPTNIKPSGHFQFLLPKTPRFFSILSQGLLPRSFDQSSSQALGFLCLFIVIGAGLWALSASSALTKMSYDFYQAGALVFGGGHVVLPLLESASVETQLISEEAFLAGYGAAQALPGPLFSFAGFIGAMAPETLALNHATINSPNNNDLTAQIMFCCAAIGAIFLPRFLLLLAALPLWQKIQNTPKLRASINGINACVVGLLAAALIDPILLSSIGSLTDACIALTALMLLRSFKLGVLYVLLFCTLSRISLSFLGL